MRNKYTHHHLQQQEQDHHHLQQEQKHHHLHLKQEEQDHLHLHRQRSRYLPTLCTTSTKQVIKHSVSHRRCSSTSAYSSPASTVSEDPLSPRVGCMGQVKRNNKVVGFPTRPFVGGFSSTTAIATTTTAAASNGACTKTNIKSHDHINNYSSNSIVKYHKLKRFFSTKSLTSSPTTTFTTAVGRSGTHKAGKSAGRITSAHNNDYSNSRGIRAESTVLRDDNGMVSRSKIDENSARAIGTDYRKKSDYENDKGSFVNLMDLDPPLPVVKQQQEQKQGNNGENVSLWKRRSRGAPLQSLQVQVTQQHCNLLLQPTTV